MKPRLILCILLLLLVSGCTNKEIIKNDNKTTITESSDQMKEINVIISDITYKLRLEDNETTKEFLEKLPQEFTMSELNGNEKYVYMNYTLPTNKYHPSIINKGDIMLYGNNCLVIFYESSNTSYSYTKIGHIDNLPDLGSGSITIRFEE